VRPGEDEKSQSLNTDEIKRKKKDGAHICPQKVGVIAVKKEMPKDRTQSPLKEETEGSAQEMNRAGASKTETF